MRGIQEQVKRFYTAVEQWIPVRVETIEKIETSIETLRVHHRNVSRIAGSTAAAASPAALPHSHPTQRPEDGARITGNAPVPELSVCWAPHSSCGLLVRAHMVATSALLSFLF